MAELWDQEAQAVVNVPDADVPAALSSGRLGISNKHVVDGRTNLVKPDGSTVSVPLAQVQKAVARGYRIPSSAEHRVSKESATEAASPWAGTEKAVGQVGSVGLGVLDAVTMGLFSGTAGKEGSEYTRLKLQQAKDRGGYTAGLIGGSLLPTGAVGLAGRGAGALTKAPVASTALRGAAEGAVIGAGDLISEEGLGRAEFTASAVAAHVGMGAILGGGVSGLLAAAPKVIPAAQRAVGQMPGKAKVQDFLKELSDDQAIKTAVGHSKKAFKHLDKKDLYEDAAKFIREDAGLALGDSTASMAEKIPAAVERLNAQADELISKLDDLVKDVKRVPVTPGPGGRFQKAVKGRVVTGELIARRIREAAEKDFGGQALKGTRNWMLQQADDIAKMEHMTFAEAAFQRRQAQAAARYSTLDPKEMALAKRLIPRAWNDTIDEAAAPFLKKAGIAEDAWKQLRHKQRVGISLAEHAEDRMAGNLANSFLSISDIMTGSGAGVMTGSALAGLAAAGARKAAKEYGSAAVSLAAGRLAKMRFLQTAQQQVGQRVQGSVLKLLAGGKPRAISPASVAALTKFTLGDGKAATQQEAAKLRVAEVDKALADPSYLADRIAASIGGLEGDAPNTSAALAGKATQALQYLASVAPRPSGLTIQPLLQAQEWKPSRAEAAKFARCWAAVMDPLSVVDDLEAGILSSEAIEALRAVYPELLDLIATEVQMQAAAHGKPISYATKVQLSMLLGKPLDNSLTPEAIKRNQSFAQAENAAGKGGGSTRLAGIDQLDMNISSRTQQLEASVAMMK
jgi:hypothetical protein